MVTFVTKDILLLKIINSWVMRVCFISLEYFGWGKYGGIGKATRDIASGLAERGVDISVLVPLGVGQSDFESVDGVDVYGFPFSKYPFIGGMLRDIGADVYHSGWSDGIYIPALYRAGCHRDA